MWNGFAYALLAFGTKVEAPGVTAPWIYGPETGFVGLALNAAFAAALWHWTMNQRSSSANSSS